jgi:hypothetical protein
MAALEKSVNRSPGTYQEWLSCFDYLRESSAVDEGTVELIKNGSFVSSGQMMAAFQTQLMETINTMLNKRVGRFIKDLNRAIEFNELEDIAFLYVKLRNETGKCLFFENLNFLDVGFRRELIDSIKQQVTSCWNSTLRFLRQQSVEYSNSGLEDALFLIYRIKLFQE